METLNKKASDKSSSAHTKSTADKSSSDKTKSTVDTSKKEKKEDQSDDTDEEDETRRQHTNLAEKQKQLDTIFEVDEEEKVEKLETPSNRTTKTSSLIKKSSLSAKTTRIFTPSTLRNKDKGFEVDEKGLLKITKFSDSLNIKFTNQLAEFFKKTSVRFKNCPKMDTTTYLKTLYNMYNQHYNKHFKETGEFNSETSSILFPQIIKFMYHRKFIQGRLLTLFITE